MQLLRDALMQMFFFFNWFIKEVFFHEKYFEFTQKKNITGGLSELTRFSNLVNQVGQILARMN